MKKTLKRTLSTLLILGAIALIYSCMPRVWYNKSAYGTEMLRADLLWLFVVVRQRQQYGLGRWLWWTIFND